MRTKIPYFLGLIGALGFTLGIIGALNPKYSFTEILFGDPFVNNDSQITPSSEIDYSLNNLDDEEISFLRKSITIATIRELSDLVKANTEGTAEAGGELRLTDRLMVYEAPNENSKIIEELENMNLRDPATLDYMLGLVNSKFSGTNQCMAENADVNWQDRIRKTREAIESSQRNFGDPISALNNLIEDLRDTYVKGVIIGKPKGVLLGDLHTHNNAATFSDVDLCISHTRTLFLVSHNYPNISTFNFYATRNGKVVDFGEYDIN